MNVEFQRSNFVYREVALLEPELERYRLLTERLGILYHQDPRRTPCSLHSGIIWLFKLLQVYFQRAPVTQRSQEISSLDLDDIDKICIEIQQEENERSKRKRGFEKISKQAKDSVELNQDMKHNKDRNLLEKAVPMVIEHLNKFGVCVIDDFLGKERGEDIMIEVQGLQQLLRDGQTGGSGEVSHEYRSDRIVWTDGIHPHSPNLRELIRSNSYYHCWI